MRASDPDTTHRTFVSYIDRTRDYYAAQGYERPYRWARFQEVPFAPLPKPLSECRLSVVTTASPIPERPPTPGVLRAGKQVWSGSTEDPPQRLFTDDLSWDRGATHMEDIASFLPIARLQEPAASGRIGSLASHFHGVPTDYSQRRTREQDAPEVLRRCREDGVDAALLVPI